MMKMDATNFYPSLPYTSKKMLVLFVKTKNCEPCNKMEPIVKKLSEEMAGHAIFGVMDKTENGEIVAGLGLDIFPSFAIFKNETMVAKTSGSRSETALHTWITQHEIGGVLGEQDLIGAAEKWQNEHR